jgi:uncharacterized protein (TIGR02217 family)
MREPYFNTRKSSHASGKTTRSTSSVFPIWRFTLTYEVLLSDPSTMWLQQLRGFFEAQYGQDAPFLFLDPEFYNAFHQVLGIGNGAQTDFPFVRSLGAYYTEPIGQVGTLVNAYLGGVVQGSGFSVQYTPYPVLRFATAPGAGVQVMADFTYYFVCRFMVDDIDFEEFMHLMHTVQQCQLTSVKP